METLTQLLDFLKSALPAVLLLALVIAVLLLSRRILQARERATPGHKIRTQVIMLVLSAIGLLLVILALPLGDTLRGQLLGLIGIVMSAAIALSSTTLLGNMLAGAMLRAERHFRIGDFIRVGEHFGRVTERALFHTEIQNADRELTTLPNLFLATNPVTTVRTSGTIVSATLSLGYDVPRKRVEQLLLEAAEGCKLREPFVQIVELGDFAVTYRVAGMLTEVKNLISTRSRLRGKMMDSLHGGGIEIVSPAFMNQRRLDLATRFIPRRETGTPPDEEATAADRLAFDKAEKAETLEALKGRQAGLTAEADQLRAQAKAAEDKAERERLRKQAEVLDARAEHLGKLIEQRKRTDSELP